MSKRLLLAAALLLAAVLALAAPAAAADVDLLTAPTFRIDGALEEARTGDVVDAAGDVNGDGLDDLVLGGPDQEEAHVVFGTPDGTGTDLGAFGAGGFSITRSSSQYQFAYEVSGAGDVNGDGLEDVIVNAFQPSGAYVVFGKTGTAPVHVETLGSGGYLIRAPEGDSVGDVADAGDVNGDGRSDALVVAGDTTYVVFGSASTETVALGNLGQSGYKIRGHRPSTHEVGSAGDVNGDGLADVLIGETGHSHDPGRTYVVFGKTTTEDVELPVLESRGGGYLILGAHEGDDAGAAVAVLGDVNGDAIPDHLIGAPSAGFPERDVTGAAYVVFGKATTSRIELEALGAGDGYTIRGAHIYDRAGASVASAGDVNRDGHPDALIGAPLATAASRRQAGVAYVVYLGPGSGGDVDLLALGDRGYALLGAGDGDLTGTTVTGPADFDGDHAPDLVAGAPDADPRGRIRSGSVHVVPTGVRPVQEPPGGTGAGGIPGAAPTPPPSPTLSDYVVLPASRRCIPRKTYVIRARWHPRHPMADLRIAVSRLLGTVGGEFQPSRTWYHRRRTGFPPLRSPFVLSNRASASIDVVVTLLDGSQVAGTRIYRPCAEVRRQRR